MRRSTWLFSATFPAGIQDLIKGCMSANAHSIQIDQANVVNRDIDATFGGADLHLLLDKGVTLPVSTKGKGPAFSIYASLLATDDFITRYPAHTTRLVKQLIRASQWASDEANRAALLQLWGDQSGQGEAVYKAEFDGESLKSRHSPRIDEAAVSVYKSVVADGLKLGLINISSPIARALIGKEEGDVAEVQAPGGVRRYEIVAVHYL